LARHRYPHPHPHPASSALKQFSFGVELAHDPCVDFSLRKIHILIRYSKQTGEMP
jgi:hypothetical protein